MSGCVFEEAPACPKSHHQRCDFADRADGADAWNAVAGWSTVRPAASGLRPKLRGFHPPRQVRLNLSRRDGNAIDAALREHARMRPSTQLGALAIVQCRAFHACGFNVAPTLEAGDSLCSEQRSLFFATTDMTIATGVCRVFEKH